METKKKIKNFIFTLIESEGMLNNKDVYHLFKKYENVSDNQLVENDILKDYRKIKAINDDKLKEIKDYNIQNNFTGEFSNRGIYTINDLYKYMNDNFEYGGVLEIDNKRIKLPFGPVNGVAKNNIITRYQDEDVFNFIVDFYNKLNGNDEWVNQVKEQYCNKEIDICTLKEYQQIIYKTSSYIQCNMWKQRNVKEILNDQISNCYESSFLVGEFLKSKGIKYQKYMIGRYDNISLAHMFITYTIDGKYYYFEQALNDFKGIYEYLSKSEMEQDIFVKFIYNDNYKMDNNLNFDNYFLKPIEDLDPNGSFTNYFEYFSAIESISFIENNYNILKSLTDLVLKEDIGIGKIYIDGSNYFYEQIELPSRENFYDIELWKKKVFNILRKKIINIGFYNLNKVFTINPLGGFNRYNVNDVKEKKMELSNRITVPNIYSIGDLEEEVKCENIVKVKDILMFSLLLENKKDLYEYGCYFASNLSGEIIRNLKNKEDGAIPCRREDIYLNGTIEKNILITSEDFLNQVVPIVSSLEVVCSSINLVVDKDYSKDLINAFVDYLIYMIEDGSLDVEKLKNENDSNNSIFIDELFAKLIGKLLNNSKK